MVNFKDIPSYRRFANQKDQALEKILTRSRIASTHATDVAFSRIIDLIRSRYSGLVGIAGVPDKMKLDRLDHDIEHVFNTLTVDLTTILNAQRRKAYLLSYLAEHYAIAKITKNEKPTKQTTKKDVMLIDNEKLVGDKDPLHYFDARLSQLRREIISSVQKSIVLDDDTDKAVWKVYSLFPKKVGYGNKRALKKIQESAQNNKRVLAQIFGDDEGSDAGLGVGFSAGPRGGFSTDEGVIDDVTWNQVLSDMTDETQPIDRSPENVFDIRNPYTDVPAESIDSKNAIYGWEVEQEMTHEFVEQVRSGQIEAAKDNGIDDFMWLAILDQKTCDNCCSWRDGLSSTQIQQKLSDQPELADYCDAIVPPAHFNCRCTMAPMDKNLDMPDTDQALEDFDSWLNNQ